MLLLNRDEKHDLEAFRARLVYDIGGEKNKLIRAILQSNLAVLNGLLGDEEKQHSVQNERKVSHWMAALLSQASIRIKQDVFNYPACFDDHAIYVRSSDLLKFARGDASLREILPQKISSHVFSRMLDKEGLIAGREKEAVVRGKRYAHMKIIDIPKLEAFIDKHLDRSIP